MSIFSRLFRSALPSLAQVLSERVAKEVMQLPPVVTQEWLDATRLLASGGSPEEVSERALKAAIRFHAMKEIRR